MKNFQNAKKFLAIGEIMMRLTPPDYGMLRTADTFAATYGGSEANVAISLANLGVDSSFFSVVPDHQIGKAAMRSLIANNVSCDDLILSSRDETPTYRLGTYYLEKGFGIRSSKVVYDRKNSAITEYDYAKVDFDALVSGYDWIHLSGITPALCENCQNMIMSVLEAAKRQDKIVSFDGNFRSTLWSWEEAREFCTKCLPYVDVLFGIEPYNIWKDDSDHSLGDVKDGLSMQPTKEEQHEVFCAFAEKYPNIKLIARHVRTAHSGSENSLKAYVWAEGATFESSSITFEILDRVGGGDAFAAGFIYGILKGFDIKHAADFAVAASALEHTVNGDANLIDDPQIVEDVLKSGFDIKR